MVVKKLLLGKPRICLLLSVLCMTLLGCMAEDFAREYTAGQSYYKDGVAALKRGALDDAMYNFDMAEWHLDWASWNYYFRWTDDISEDAVEAVRQMAAITNMWRGSLFSQRGQHKKAVKEFSEALSYGGLTHQQRATITGMRGNSSFDLGNRTNATDDYHKALELDPKSDVVRNLGRRLGF